MHASLILKPELTFLIFDYLLFLVNAYFVFFTTFTITIILVLFVGLQICNPLFLSSLIFHFSRYDAIAFDVFRSENRITPVTSLYSLPELDQHARSFSHPHVPPLFVLNLQVRHFIGHSLKNSCCIFYYVKCCY